MSQYCNTHTYILRHSDFDLRNELKPSALLSLTQESAGFSAEELGFGVEELKKKGCGFIIVNTYCRLFRPARLGETLTVDTWPLPPRHVIFERDYRVRSGEETVAAVASRWCLVDLNDFSLLTPERLGESHDRCPYRAEQTAEVPSWKIPKPGASAREVLRLRVGYSHCDYYLHANNTRYADFFFDCFSSDELRGVKSFQIAYGKQAKEGAELTFFREDCGDISVCEAHSGEETIAQFRIEFTEPRS